MFKSIKLAHSAGWRAGMCRASALMNPYKFGLKWIAWDYGWERGTKERLTAYLLGK